MRTRNGFSYILTWISCLLLLPCTGAHAQPPAGAQKLQNIRKLIVILGGLDLQQLGLRDEPASPGSGAEQPQTRHGEAPAKGVDEKALQGLVDRLVPVYDKYLTEEDVSEMLKFYESRTGKRVALAMPRLREESRRITLEWRQGLVKKPSDKPGGLVRAVAAGETALVKELLSGGANVNERNSRGVTALIAAAHNSEEPVFGNNQPEHVTLEVLKRRRSEIRPVGLNRRLKSSRYVGDYAHRYMPPLWRQFKTASPRGQ